MCTCNSLKSFLSCRVPDLYRAGDAGLGHGKPFRNEEGTDSGVSATLSVIAFGEAEDKRGFTSVGVAQHDNLCDEECSAGC